MRSQASGFPDEAPKPLVKNSLIDIQHFRSLVSCPANFLLNLR